MTEKSPEFAEGNSTGLKNTTQGLAGKLNGLNMRGQAKKRKEALYSRIAIIGEQGGKGLMQLSPAKKKKTNPNSRKQAGEGETLGRYQP